MTNTINIENIKSIKNGKVILSNDKSVNFSEKCNDHKYCLEVINHGIKHNLKTALFINENNEIINTDYTDNDIVKTTKETDSYIEISFNGHSGIFNIAKENKEYIIKLRQSEKTKKEICFVYDKNLSILAVK